MEKMVIKRLDINLFYCSEWNDFTFLELLNGNGWVQTDDLDVLTFYNAQGGIELKMDRLFLFFKETSLSDHIQAVYFLLQSLCEVLELQDDPNFKIIWPDDKKSEKLISMALGVDSYLNLVCNAGNKLINIQYVHNNRKIEDLRNNPYFDNIWVDYSTWGKAVSIALNEYFSVVYKMFSNEINQNSLPQYTKFYNIWNDIKVKFNE